MECYQGLQLHQYGRWNNPDRSIQWVYSMARQAGLLSSLLERRHGLEYQDLRRVSEAARGGLGEVVRGSKLVVVQDARPKK